MMAAQQEDPKSALNQFIQTYCKRPVSKTDIVYTAQSFGGQFQATIKLNCLEGQEFAGEMAPNAKLAEKNAAKQALLHYADVIAGLPQNPTKKRKTTGSSAVFPPNAKFANFGAPGVVAPPAGAGASVLGDNTPDNPKMLLNTVCMKIIRRMLGKGEIAYECVQTPMGYQCTVQCKCLSGDMGQSVWAGEVATDKKKAEQNAAKIALESINPQLELLQSQQVNSKPPVPAIANGGAGGADGGDGGKGWMKGMKGMFMMGKGKMKGWGKGKGKAQMMTSMHGVSSMADLPRERVTQVAVTGEVVEWKGKYGWVKPHSPIEHEKADPKKEGKLFVSKKDLVGIESLDQGAQVTFQVYSDPSGLGAEEVKPF